MTGPLEPFRLDGTELAGYLIHSLAGRGGMAYVYRAEHRRLGRTVALKVLAPELAQNEDFRRRFLRESRLAASLDHPNIIPIYDAGEANGLLYIAMRYVEGSDLKVLLAGERQLDPSRVVEIFSQVAAALDAAHASGLVHRDVKPANILISSPAGGKGHDHVYLSDFGVTKRAASLSGTEAGAIIGTMDYVAPEQIAGKAVSARTDVYALGCVVYQSLTGTVPFVRDDEAALLWAHLVEAPPAVSRRRPDLPPTVQAVLAKAMAKASDERYSSCGEFIAALAAQLHAEHAPTGKRLVSPREPAEARTGNAAPAPARPADPAPRADTAQPRAEDVREHAAPDQPASPALVAPRRRRRGKVLGLLAGALAVVIALIAFQLLRGGPPSTSRFTADNLVPFSFTYPADWGRAGDGTNVVFSPHAEDVLPLFTQRGEAQSWSAIRRLTRQDPREVLGMYTSFVSAQYGGASTGELQEVLRPLLPARLAFTGENSRASLGDFGAARLDGVLSDPTSGTPRLRFECYIAPTGTDEPRTVYLVFFSTEDSFDRNRVVFDRIARSVDLGG